MLEMSGFMLKGYDDEYINERIKYWKQMELKFFEHEEEKALLRSTDELLKSVREINEFNTIEIDLADLQVHNMVAYANQSHIQFLKIKSAFCFFDKATNDNPQKISFIISKVFQAIKGTSINLGISYLIDTRHYNINLSTSKTINQTQLRLLAKELLQTPIVLHKKGDIFPLKSPIFIGIRRNLYLHQYTSQPERLEIRKKEDEFYGEKHTYAIIGILVE